jgi:hypothetical protein
MEPGELRAGDEDRERVAHRLRIALDEGRLNLYEYDDRLREAYAARTYAELDKLLSDLPTPRADLAVPERGTVDRPGPDGRYPASTRRWLVDTWDQWLSANAICLGIWAVISLAAGGLTYFWPFWVAAPWGVVLLVQTIRGLATGEPERWAAKQARKQAERELRRQARGQDQKAIDEKPSDD